MLAVQREDAYPEMIAEAGARTDCPVCRRPGAPWHRPKGFALRWCAACGFGWMADVLRSDFERWLYDGPYFQGAPDGYPDYLAAEASIRRTAREHLDVLDRLHVDPRPPGGAGRGRLLDVGCAAGFFLDEARRRGWEVAGVDPSAAMCAHARDTLGLDVLRGPCEALLGDDRQPPADAIVLLQVLCHVEDPLGTCLAHAARRLRPGGTLLLELWDCESRTARLLGRRWTQLTPPSVKFWFSLRSVQAALARHGLTPVEVARPGKAVDVQRVIAQAASRWSPRLGRLVRVLSERTGIARATVRYPLDDLVRVVARRGS